MNVSFDFFIVFIHFQRYDNSQNREWLSVTDLRFSGFSITHMLMAGVLKNREHLSVYQSILDFTLYMNLDLWVKIDVKCF